MRRRGFTLLTMVSVLILLSVAVLVANRLFATTMIVFRQTAEAQNRSARFDHMMRLLRADAWGAAKIECAEGACTFIAGDGARVKWRTMANGMVERQGSPPHRWAYPGTELRFEERQGILLLHVRDVRSGTVDSAVLERAMGGRP